jgi:hypothetical protein
MNAETLLLGMLGLIRRFLEKLLVQKNGRHLGCRLRWLSWKTRQNILTRMLETRQAQMLEDAATLNSDEITW